MMTEAIQAICALVWHVLLLLVAVVACLAVGLPTVLLLTDAAVGALNERRRKRALRGTDREG